MNQVDTFRVLDYLLGINQACNETTAQLRIGHLYQLQKDRKSIYERLFLIVIAALTIIPTLDKIYPDTPLKWYWGGALLLFGFVLYLVERDRLVSKHEEYEDIDIFDAVVKNDKITLLRDYIYSYVTRYDLAYSIHQNADANTKPYVRAILESYAQKFVGIRRQLDDVMKEHPLRLTSEEYDGLNKYIKQCETRHSGLNSAGG